MTARQLIALLNNLPPTEGALARALNGAEEVEWSLTNHLLAGLVDLQQQANFMWSDGTGPKPTPLPRPGVEPPKRRGTPHTREEIWRELRGIDPPTNEVTDGE